ncbi:DUF1684 domain-containing protein [Fulvivirgaceae bacterium BMA10]|uniref:DUF1684 domain-containing protein n=1 Tax=Splendidivirga corallicola TaxID=3051826 RepID=A0ABT8KJ94_9BACT|nr:DUF1684 domain-containing protein [Fulvivirgaceae bacterium BMA10]
MKNTRVLFIVVLVVVIGTMIYSFSGTTEEVPKEAEQDYLASVQGERDEKDLYMKESESSPLSAEDKRFFRGLSYFDVNANYKIVAKLLPFPQDAFLTMATSDGKEKRYKKFAHAQFELNGASHQLLVLQSTDPLQSNLLFLPFTDETSAEQTYGAGRYLDFEMPEKNELVIDFNLAYNPYCAYNDQYSCPFPPAENHLKIAILAGEKTFQKIN